MAGPVVAAAVCLTSFDFSCRIDDSKKMTPASRVKAFHEIFDKAHVGIGMISETVIDRVNILNASYLAMEAAVLDLLGRFSDAADSPHSLVTLLIDGNGFRSTLPYRYKTIIGGDGQCLSIACASIIAKVYRDRAMERYDQIFPEYGFKQHKGYPTAGHRAAIRSHGLSAIHRQSFIT